MITNQVRIGPVAFESSRNFGNNEVVHLLGGLRMISEAQREKEKGSI